MAFENVFGNVDFGMPVRQAEANRNYMMQMMGMGIQQGQFAQKMDMERRQLEAKANEFNLKQTAETALMKRNMGIPTSPQEDAAIQTMSQIAPPTYTTDPFGRIISQPSGWGRVNPQTGAGTFTGQPLTNGPSNIGPQGQGSNPALTMNYADIQPLDFSGVEGFTSNQQMEGMGYNPTSPAMNMSGARSEMEQMYGQTPQIPMTPQAKSLYDQSPTGIIKTGETNIGLQDYAAKKGIDLNSLSKQKQMELEFEMLKDKKKMDAQKEAGMPTKMAESSIMIEDIGRALNALGEGGFLPKTGTIGGILSPFSETGAGQLSDYLKSVQNLVGFGKLSSMREQSPTGSSGLGALSETEMEGLKSTSGNLEVSQRKEDLAYNLKRLHNQQMDLVHGTPEHIAKVAEEKNLPEDVVRQLSFRYPLKAKITPEQARAELRRRGK